MNYGYLGALLFWGIVIGVLYLRYAMFSPKVAAATARSEAIARTDIIDRLKVIAHDIHKRPEFKSLCEKLRRYDGCRFDGEYYYWKYIRTGEPLRQGFEEALHVGGLEAALAYNSGRHPADEVNR